MATDETNTAPADAVVRLRKSAAFDCEMCLSYLCKVIEQQDGLWKWFIYDVDSILKIPEKAGIAVNEDEAKTDCRTAMAGILRSKLESIRNLDLEWL